MIQLRLNTQLSVDVFVLGLGLGSMLKKRRKPPRDGGEERVGEPDFTFCACCKQQKADLQHGHAWLSNKDEMKAVPKDYMKISLVL